MRWISESDNGMGMLRCESCDARVIEEHYRKAVALKGFSHCPYCGAELDAPKDIQQRLAELQTDCSWK